MKNKPQETQEFKHAAHFCTCTRLLREVGLSRKSDNSFTCTVVVTRRTVIRFLSSLRSDVGAKPKRVIILQTAASSAVKINGLIWTQRGFVLVSVLVWLQLF